MTYLTNEKATFRQDYGTKLDGVFAEMQIIIYGFIIILQLIQTYFTYSLYCTCKLTCIINITA